MNVDVQGAGVGAVETDLDVLEIDPRLPLLQRGPHVVGDRAGRTGVYRGEDVVVHPAGCGRQDQPDGLLDLAIPDHQSHPAGGIGGQRERPAGADEIGSDSRNHRHPPISTVGAPTMIGAPQMDMSPIRAAGSPPISTVGHPGGAIADGGCTAGGGNEQMCGVPTVAAAPHPSPTRAAGMPAMRTVGTPGGPITPG